MHTNLKGPKTLNAYIDALPIPEALHASEHEEDKDSCKHLKITMDCIEAQLHSELPATTSVWAYNQQFPGPTVEVRRGENVEVEWTNNLCGCLPYATALAADPTGTQDIPQNIPGANGAKPEPGVEMIEPWNVVHLHGGKTPPDSDGQPENMIPANQSKMSTYPNDQRATSLWYHDHAMSVTRYNVYAGLAGFWLIRDKDDDAIMKSVEKNEIPLLIQDRNLETDANGNLTGQMLHKIEENTREFFGPYTLVNGVIWPFTEVKARPYRLRLLNGSNSRVYGLVLLDENNIPVNDAMFQIGTDGGLLDKPVGFAASEGLFLAPGERADVLIDFSRFRGKSVQFVNIAGAPYHDSNFTIPTPGQADLGLRVPYPQVMQFRVKAKDTGKSFANLMLPNPLSDFARSTINTANLKQRWIALVEDGTTHMLSLRELVPVANTYTGPKVEINDGLTPTQTFRVGAQRFEDTVNYFVAAGATEVWKFINLTVDVHPMHVHLVQFQALSQQIVDNPATFSLTTNSTTAGPIQIQAAQISPNPHDQGWKDTLRVNPSEVVSIIATFEGFLGRYMYHCHIIEHEDAEMMRPFVVLPAPIAMQMDGMGMM